MPLIYENPDFSEAEEELEKNALDEALQLSTKRLFNKLYEREIKKIRITSLLHVIWKLPHLVDEQQLPLQYVGRNVLVRAAGFKCGPTTGPVPALYNELLKSCKVDPLCTFLLRLSVIPLREIGETALNVMLQVLPYDVKHMHVSDRMEFGSRLCIFVSTRRRNSNDLLPLLLSCRIVANVQVMIPWFRKPLLDIADSMLKYLLQAVVPVTENEMDRHVEIFVNEKIKDQITDLLPNEIRRLKRVEIGKEKRLRVTEKEKYADAFDLLCRCIGDLCENDHVVQDMVLSCGVFDTLVLQDSIGGQVYDEFINTAILDLLWRLSFSNKIQKCMSEKVVNDENNFLSVLLSHCRATSIYALQSIGIIWNSLRMYKYVERLLPYFERVMDEDICTDNHLLNRITRVVVESEDLEILTVACGLSAELLSTDFTLFYMTQQDGFMNKVEKLLHSPNNVRKSGLKNTIEDVKEGQNLSDEEAREYSRCCKEAKRVLAAARA